MNAFPSPPISLWRCKCVRGHIPHPQLATPKPTSKPFSQKLGPNLRHTHRYTRTHTVGTGRKKQKQRDVNFARFSPSFRRTSSGLRLRLRLRLVLVLALVLVILLVLARGWEMGTRSSEPGVQRQCSAKTQISPAADAGRLFPAQSVHSTAFFSCTRFGGGAKPARIRAQGVVEKCIPRKNRGWGGLGVLERCSRASQSVTCAFFWAAPACLSILSAATSTCRCGRQPGTFLFSFCSFLANCWNPSYLWGARFEIYAFLSATGWGCVRKFFPKSCNLDAEQSTFGTLCLQLWQVLCVVNTLSKIVAEKYFIKFIKETVSNYLSIIVSII